MIRHHHHTSLMYARVGRAGQTWSDGSATPPSPKNLMVSARLSRHGAAGSYGKPSLGRGEGWDCWWRSRARCSAMTTFWGAEGPPHEGGARHMRLSPGGGRSSPWGTPHTVIADFWGRLQSYASLGLRPKAWATVPAHHPFLSRGAGDCVLLVLPDDVGSPPPSP